MATPGVTEASLAALMGSGMVVGVTGSPARAGTPPPAPGLTEEQFQAAVIKLARANGWLVYHTRDSRKSEAGYPDLTIVRERLVVAELKTETGRLSAAQETWADALRGAGVEYYLWRPSMWTAVCEVLR